MKAVITDKLLRSLRSPHEPVWDQTLRGFGARIGDTGISFIVMRRVRGGDRQPVRITLGRYHPKLLPLSDAREKARLLLRQLEDGVDPRERKRELAEAKVAQAKAEGIAKERQFDAVAEAFIERHAAKKRTARAITLRIRRELIARWGTRPIDEITRTDVIAMVDALVDAGTPAAADQTLRYCRRLFRWAIGRGIIDRSPCDHLNAADLVGPRKPRQRLLTDDELRLIWRATEGGRYPDDQYLRLLLLLGARRSELARARWDEIDLDRTLWIVPPERMKSDERHSVPLPPAAVEILRKLPRFASGYVFTAKGTRAVNDFGAIKMRLDFGIARLNGNRLIDAWTFHDARRTFRTGLSSLGIAPHIAELCIGHRQPGLMRTYDLHRFEAEKRHALEAWAARVLGIVGPRPDKVTRCGERNDSLK